MKKMTAAAIAVLTLAAVGCQKKETEDSKAPDYTLTIMESAEEGTASSTEETESPSETAAAPSEEATDAAPVTTEASPTETEPAASEEETSEEAEQETETFVAGETDDALIGTWEYENGFRIQLMEQNAMVMFVDYSGVMNFDDGCFSIGEMDCSISADADGVTAVYDNETILHMTPESGTNSVSLQGLYHLEDCYVYDSVAGVLTENYYILLEGEKLFLGTTGFYNAADGELLLFSAGDTLTLQYEIHEKALVITDENDQTDVLTKME